MQGEFSFACLKRSRTRLAPTPTNISTKSEPEIEKNGTSASPAIALASSVLPQPGGPTSSTPRGMRPPSRWNFLGFLRNSMISVTSSLASSMPATSSKVTLTVSLVQTRCRRLAEVAEHAAGAAARGAHRAGDEEPDDEQEQEDRRDADKQLHPDAAARVRFPADAHLVELVLVVRELAGRDRDEDRGALVAARLEAGRAGLDLRDDPGVLDDHRAGLDLVFLEISRELLEGLDLPHAPARAGHHHPEQDHEREQREPRERLTAVLRRRRHGGRLPRSPEAGLSSRALRSGRSGDRDIGVPRAGAGGPAGRAHHSPCSESTISRANWRTTSNPASSRGSWVGRLGVKTAVPTYPLRATIGLPVRRSSHS